MLGRREKVPSLDALIAEQIGQNGRLFFRIAYGVLRDRAAAQDAVQAALLKGWEWRGDLKNAGKLRNWLASVVVRESLQLRRRGKIEQRVLARQGAVVGAAIGESHDTADLRDAVLTALEQLPQNVRIIVIMRTMQGVSGKEVAKFLDCSESEVSRKWKYGLEFLSGPLADWNPNHSVGESD